jgi:23S rRNA pseudouridine1911/1915/1917 synthase
MTAPAGAERHAWTATPAEAGQRFDRVLHGRLPALSRARLQALVRAGHATLDGRPAAPHTTVRAGAPLCLTIPPPVPAQPRPEAIPLNVLYEDCDLLVVNKPSGLVVHPAPGHAGGTLVNALLYHCRDLAGVGGEERPGIVHRLDKDTSGALVVAKHDRALRGLQDAFRAGAVTKVYTALVLGRPDPPTGTIATLVGRSRHDRKKMAVQPPAHTGAGGRRAVSHYRLDETLGPCARLTVRIETGRTHQIRVQLAHIGCPVLGDRQYGRRALPAPIAALHIPRQMLHAARLAFPHPVTRRPIALTAPAPEDMKAVLELLRTTG